MFLITEKASIGTFNQYLIDTIKCVIIHFEKMYSNSNDKMKPMKRLNLINGLINKEMPNMTTKPIDFVHHNSFYFYECYEVSKLNFKTIYK